MFNQDDPFSDPFFSNPFSQVGERREVEIKSEPVALEVKPLPPNAPVSFSGAIGNFTMATDAKPRTVQVGDPITVTTTISGRGNFDRVNAPVVEDERGWHKYPPSSKFKQDDEVGISGTKTFEMVLSPNEKKQGLPLLAFSYFDPVKEQYVTLHSEAIPLNVEGGTAVTQNAGAPQTGAPSPAMAHAASPIPTATKPQDNFHRFEYVRLHTEGGYLHGWSCDRFRMAHARVKATGDFAEPMFIHRDSVKTLATMFKVDGSVTITVTDGNLNVSNGTTSLVVGTSPGMADEFPTLLKQIKDEVPKKFAVAKFQASFLADLAAICKRRGTSEFVQAGISSRTRPATFQIGPDYRVWIVPVGFAGEPDWLPSVW